MAEKSRWEDKNRVEKRWGKYGDPGASARENWGGARSIASFTTIPRDTGER